MKLYKEPAGHRTENRVQSTENSTAQRRHTEYTRHTARRHGKAQEKRMQAARANDSTPGSKRISVKCKFYLFSQDARVTTPTPRPLCILFHQPLSLSSKRLLLVAQLFSTFLISISIKHRADLRHTLCRCLPFLRCFPRVAKPHYLTLILKAIR